MKVKTLSALAGAASVLACGSAQAVPTVGYVLNTTDPFLVANNLQSATIRLENIAAGETFQGFIGTATTPWTISTTGGGFFNLSGEFVDGNGNPTFNGATSFYAATNASAPGGVGANFDSGLLGNPGTFGEPAGNPGDQPGGFALSGDGSSESFPVAAWISINPAGFDPPGSTYNFLRVTWLRTERFNLSLLLAGNTPAQEVPLTLNIPAVPAPGALALLGLAGLVGTRRRRN